MGANLELFHWYGMLIGSFLLAIVLRLIPLRLWQIDSSDAWSHIYDAAAIKKNGGLPRQLKGFFPIPEFTYPWAISWLLYRLEPKNPLHFAIRLNIAFNLVEMIVASVMAWRFGGVQAAVIASAIYAVSPLTFSPWAGVYGINARVFGALLTNISLAAMALGITDGNYFAYTVPVLLSPFVILSSQFGVQSLILGAVVLAMFYGSLLPVIVLLGGVVFAIIITGGRAVSIMRGHLNHVIYYARHLQFHNVGTVHRTWGVSRWLKELISAPSIRQAVSTVVWTPLLRVFAWNPWLLLLLFAFLSSTPTISASLKGLLVLVLTGLCVIPLITLHGLRFLGEADRYFTFISTLPLAVLVGVYVDSQRELIGFVIVWLMAVIACAVMIRVRAGISQTEGVGPEIEVARELTRLCSGKEGRVLVVPQNYADKLACFCECVFVAIHTNVTWDRRQWPVYSALFSKFYPYPSAPVELLKEWGVSYLVVAKRFVDPVYLARHHLPTDLVELPRCEPYSENERYAIYVL